MTRTLAFNRWLAGAVLVLLFAAARAQTPQVYVNGMTAGPVPIEPRAVAVLDVTGPAAQAFAVRIGFVSAQVPTAYGVLGLHPADPEAFFILNGFDPGHFNHASSFLPSTGPFTAFCMPFTDPQQPPGFRFYGQACVADPSAPAGATLTNTVEVVSTLPAPLVTGGITNFTAANGLLYITGENFSPSLAQNQVTVDGQACTVIDGDIQSLNVRLPPEAQSGPITVNTPGGSGGGNPNLVATWCAVVTNLLTEQQVPDPITDRTTVQGQLGGFGQRDAYVVHAEAGEEIYAEAYSWDPCSCMITGPTNTLNAYLDLVLRIRRGETTLVMDDDSGPSLNAAIGCTGGASFFIADQPGDYIVEVDTYLSMGSGSYLLVVGTRGPTAAPVTVQSLLPNIARSSDLVTALVTGVDPGNPAGHEVRVGGLSAAIVQVLPGRIDFLVPPGAKSAPVSILTPNGTSTASIDRMATWLCVAYPTVVYEQEGCIPTIAPETTVIGSISYSGDADVFRFEAVPGHQYRVEVTALDASQTRAVTGAFLCQNPADPEVHITPAGALLPSYAADSCGGPGINALIGNGAEAPPFTAPAAAAYDVHVATWFGLSRGAYLLNLVDLTP